MNQALAEIDRTQESNRLQNQGSAAMLEAMHRLLCGLIFLALSCASPSPTASIESPHPNRDSNAAASPPTAGEPKEVDTTQQSSSASRPEPRAKGTIYRDELNRATQGGKTGYLLQQLSPEANRQNGRFYGWRITTLFPADPQLCGNKCDIQVGDIILSINGSPLERPEQLSALVEAIPTMDSLEILSIRDNKLRKYRYSIIDRPK